MAASRPGWYLPMPSYGPAGSRAAATCGGCVAGSGVCGAGPVSKGTVGQDSARDLEIFLEISLSTRSATIPVLCDGAEGRRSAGPD